MPKPTRSSKVAAKPKLHYNKAGVEADVRQTFHILIKALMFGVGGALIYFMGTIIYLGGWGHTKGNTFIEEFSDRTNYLYSGTKLPMYENPAYARKFDEKPEGSQ